MHFKLCFVAEIRTHAVPLTRVPHFWLSHTSHESPFWLQNHFDSTWTHQWLAREWKTCRTPPDSPYPSLFLFLLFCPNTQAFLFQIITTLSSKAACKRPVRPSVALTPQSAFCSNRKWCNGFVVSPTLGMVLTTESWQRHQVGSEEDRCGDGSLLMSSSTTRLLSLFNFCMACAVICMQLSWCQLLLTPVSLHLPTVLPRMPDVFI